MNLVIDIGNTRIKAAIYQKKILQYFFVFSHIQDMLQNAEFLPYLKQVQASIISNVADKTIVSFIQQHLPAHTSVYEVSTQLPLPFQIEYDTPHTLGSDRLAAVCGAADEFPAHHVLIIDAGTCIKYNLLIKNTFKGGAISPGLQMRYKALSHYTQHLPLLQPSDKPIPFIGKTSTDNIHSGILNGCKAEMQYFIQQCMQQTNEELKVILTGGDALFFEKLIERKVFLRPYLILNGLNVLLEYQKKMDIHK